MWIDERQRGLFPPEALSTEAVSFASPWPPLCTVWPSEASRGLLFRQQCAGRGPGKKTLLRFIYKTDEQRVKTKNGNRKISRSGDAVF